VRGNADQGAVAPRSASPGSVAQSCVGRALPDMAASGRPTKEGRRRVEGEDRPIVLRVGNSPSGNARPAQDQPRPSARRSPLGRHPPDRLLRQALHESPPSFRRKPESRGIGDLDPGFRRGDDFCRASWVGADPRLAQGNHRRLCPACPPVSSWEEGRGGGQPPAAMSRVLARPAGQGLRTRAGCSSSAR
jgi:hypothetical protein